MSLTYIFVIFSLLLFLFLFLFLIIKQRSNNNFEFYSNKYTDNHKHILKHSFVTNSLIPINQYIGVASLALPTGNNLYGIDFSNDLRTVCNTNLLATNITLFDTPSLYSNPTLGSFDCVYSDTSNNIFFSTVNYDICLNSVTNNFSVNWSVNWKNIEWTNNQENIVLLKISKNSVIIVVTDQNNIYMSSNPPKTWGSVIYNHKVSIVKVWFFSKNLYFLDTNNNFYILNPTTKIINQFQWFSIDYIQVYYDAMLSNKGICNDVVQLYVLPSNSNIIYSIYTNDTVFSIPTIYLISDIQIQSFQIDTLNQPLVLGTDNYLYTKVINSDFYQVASINNNWFYNVQNTNTNNINIIWLIDPSNNLSQLMISMNPETTLPSDASYNSYQTLDYGCQNWSAWFINSNNQTDKVIINFYKPYLSMRYSDINANEMDPIKINGCADVVAVLGSGTTPPAVSCKMGYLTLSKSNYMKNSIYVIINDPVFSITSTADEDNSTEITVDIGGSDSIEVMLQGDTTGSYIMAPTNIICGGDKCQAEGLGLLSYCASADMDTSACSGTSFQMCNDCNCNQYADSSNAFVSCITECQHEKCGCLYCNNISDPSKNATCIANCMMNCSDCEGPTYTPSECISDCPACPTPPSNCKPCSQVLTFSQDVCNNVAYFNNNFNPNYTWDPHGSNPGLYTTDLNGTNTYISFVNNNNPVNKVVIDYTIPAINYEGTSIIQLNVGDSNISLSNYPLTDSTDGGRTLLNVGINGGFSDDFSYMSNVFNGLIMSIVNPNSPSNSQSPSIFTNIVSTYINSIYRISCNVQSVGTNRNSLSTPDFSYGVQYNQSLNIVNIPTGEIIWSAFDPSLLDVSLNNLQLIFKNDSNIVLNSEIGIVWDSSTNNTGANKLILNSEGIMQLYLNYNDPLIKVNQLIWSTDTVSKYNKYILRPGYRLTSIYGVSSLFIKHNEIYIKNMKTGKIVWKQATGNNFSGFGWNEHKLHFFGSNKSITLPLHSAKHALLTPINVLVITDDNKYYWKSTDALFYNEILTGTNKLLSTNRINYINISSFNNYLVNPTTLFFSNNKKKLILQNAKETLTLYSDKDLYALVLEDDQLKLYNRKGELVFFFKNIKIF